ncbi:potassium-transporting ATPase subunit KdpC [Sodalis ligni]|uniref:Potassium-transporting ATPase KdpC subunit n=1 Tax=Sodalis ligni TaxID=2697027 RepID=A0A4R1NHI7_9GAMM|nr:potassium-transporting ATPase subunit KdpC [Sodalis ligni]TCL05291.1 K+-transporting ATPase ATPase C chain [Sodalis ligni]
MSQLRPAVLLMILLTLMTGAVYPLLTGALGQWWFPGQAQGSLLDIGGEIRGSTLIGQSFVRPEYFQGRPSATSDSPYNALASSGSNLAAGNPDLDKAFKQRIADLRAANPLAAPAVPVDLVAASGSGLDPEISPAAAQWQAQRVAAARRLPLEMVQRLIEENTSRPPLYFLGDPAVNVLELNIALDSVPRP